MARVGEPGRHLPATLSARPAQDRCQPGQAPRRGCGEGLEDSANELGCHGTRSQVWTVRAAGQVGTAWAGASPPTGPAPTARGPAHPHPPSVLVISSTAGYEPTWLRGMSPCFGGPWAISLLLIALSKVVQVAHIAWLHTHEAGKTLHVIIPGGGWGGSEVGGEGWGRRCRPRPRKEGGHSRGTSLPQQNPGEGEAQLGVYHLHRLGL